MIRLGVVSFLNSRPLVDGLDESPAVDVRYDVPAALPARLEAGEVDVALVPIIDVIRAAVGLRVVSDACIACDGETMTVRVFSQVPPDRITTLVADTHSHTSVALARVLWRELYDRELMITPCDVDHAKVAAHPAVLLIGDKVVDQRRAGFAYEIDLGGAWRAHTGLPFVFAVWAARAEFAENSPEKLAECAGLLESARDRGVARAAEIARLEGPSHHWPVELAQRYLTRCLKFTLDGRMCAGAELFAQRAAEFGFAPADAELCWPAGLAAERSAAVTT